MDKHRIRASEAKELIEYFSDFITNDVNKLNAYRAEGHDGEYKTAIIARRLSTIAKELDMPEMEQAHKNIDKYSEELEKSLLLKFEIVYANGDKETMRVLMINRILPIL